MSEINFDKTMAEWVQIDEQIKQLNAQLSELKEEKKETTDKLNEYVENHGVNRETINVNLKDSAIKFVTTKVHQTLTFKYLEKCLNEIINDEGQIEQIIDYIKSNREINEINEIKRVYKK